MRVVAIITIENGEFSDWLAFFESYSDERHKFVCNEVIKRLDLHKAEVSFDVTDLDGLMALSAREDILSCEKKLGLSTEISQ